MNKYFDKKNNRIIFEKEKADPSFWDKRWEIDDLEKYIKSTNDNNSVIKFTKKYLPKGSKILEGGCGRGQLVYSLDKNGYNAYGIDFAQKTVGEINRVFPELKVSLGDVKKIKFDNNFFDGYWSLGVIEHFYEGYDEIAREISRVIRVGGFLFLTFPHMNCLRKLKARLGFYKIFNESEFDKNKFYQYGLDKKNVAEEMRKIGFDLVFEKSLDGTRGIKDEIKILEKFFIKIYNSRNIFFRAVKKIIEILLSSSCGHITLLVFKKIK